MPKLLLFDIDGTLVMTGGAGVRAMDRAFRDVFGVADAIGGITLAGRTDFAILADMLAAAGDRVASDDTQLARFRASYFARLGEEIQRDGPGKRILPGVRELLDALECRGDVVCALLTGNYREAAEIKLAHFGLWRYFDWGAFGGDTGERNALLPIALAEARRRGLERPDEVVVIGDTPHDVTCAHCGGARAIAVATGPHSVEALARTGADVVLSDLGDTPAVLRAMGLD